MGFSRREHWSELPFPPPGDLPDPGIEPTSPESPALAGGLFTLSHFISKENDRGGEITSEPPLPTQGDRLTSVSFIALNGKVK